MILVAALPIQKMSGNLFNDPGINKSAHTKKPGNIFYDPRMFAHREKVWKLI